MFILLQCRYNKFKYNQTSLIIFGLYHLCLSGVFRPGHPTVSGCFPSPRSSLHLSPSLFSCGGTTPNRGSFDRKDGRSPAEKDGLQVSYHDNQHFTGSESLLVHSSYSLFFHLLFLSFFLPSFFSVLQEVSVSCRVGLRRSGRRQAGAADWTSSSGGHLHQGLS